jgi:hypothetical protein
MIMQCGMLFSGAAAASGSYDSTLGLIQEQTMRTAIKYDPAKGNVITLGTFSMPWLVRTCVLHARAAASLVLTNGCPYPHSHIQASPITRTPQTPPASHTGTAVCTLVVGPPASSRACFGR